MSTLEHLTAGAVATGIDPAGPVTVVTAQWHGTQAVTLVFRDSNARVQERLLYRADEGSFSVEEGTSRAWSFDGDGHLFRLAAEARRIHLAHLFDPYLALTSSQVDPLPHQIEAVYGEMLPRQPLRFLLADDPGAGKTIMAGLYIKELMIRGDAERCLIVAPGSLVSQWEEELVDKFGLRFDIVTKDLLDKSHAGDVTSGPLTKRAKVASATVRTCKRSITHRRRSDRRRAPEPRRRSLASPPPHAPCAATTSQPETVHG